MSGEGLASLGPGGDDLEGVEADSLGERAALAHNHGVTLEAAEARGDVRSEVGVALLVTLVLLNVVEVVHTHDDGALHLGGLDNASQDAATDGNIAGERALLVNVGAWEGWKEQEREDGPISTDAKSWVDEVTAPMNDRSYGPPHMPQRTKEGEGPTLTSELPQKIERSLRLLVRTQGGGFSPHQ